MTEELLEHWWSEFDDSSSEEKFEDMYSRWQTETTVLLPAFKDVDTALNNLAVTKRKFMAFFRIFTERSEFQQDYLH